MPDMLPMPVTSTFAALFAVMLLVLSFIVSHGRRKTGTNVGDGNDPMLLGRIRAMGNFVEYVPMALILMALCEMGDTLPAALWLAGGALFLGRICHAIGMIAAVTPARAAGMVLTYLPLLAFAYRLVSIYYL